MAEKLNRTNLRAENIFSEIIKNKYCSVSDLAKKFCVSQATIKRDLDKLNKAKRIKRVHGGAFSLSTTTDVPMYELRKDIHVEAKEVIARYAASLIEDGDLIYLDAGSTIELILKYIKAKEVTIFTNAVSIILAAFNDNFDFKVNVISGELFAKQSLIMGIQTLDQIDNLYFNKVFLSAAYVDIENGLMADSYYEQVYKRKLSQRSEMVIALVDSNKINTWNKMKSVAFDNIDYFVTDKYISINIVKNIERHGTKVIKRG